MGQLKDTSLHSPYLPSNFQNPATMASSTFTLCLLVVLALVACSQAFGLGGLGMGLGGLYGGGLYGGGLYGGGLYGGMLGYGGLGYGYGMGMYGGFPGMCGGMWGRGHY